MTPVEFEPRIHRMSVLPDPHLGAIVIADNTTQFRDAHRDYFAFVNDPANGLRTLSLPFEGGLELTTKHA